MMKNFKKLFCFTLLALSQNVLADGLEGFYAGASLGYIKADDIGKEYDLDGKWNLWKQKLKPEGAALGLNIGHNWLLNEKFLLGLEAGYQKYDARDTAFQYDATTGELCGSGGRECTFKTKLDQSFSLLAKAGYLVNEKTALYALGGYTTARIERSIYDGWDQLRWMNYDKWQDGWTLGAGLEYMFMNSLSAKVEYRYTDLGTYKYYTPAFQGEYEKHRYDHDELNVGLSYHFK